MPEAAHPTTILSFGVFELDLRAGELRKRGLKVRLQEKPLQTLTLLLEHPGDVVTREELRQRIWPADTFVDFDHSINTAVKKLREALGDSAENPHFIETLPRHGYRFVGHVEPLKAVVVATATEAFHPTATESGTDVVAQPSADSAQDVEAHLGGALQAGGRRDALVKNRNGRRAAAVATGGVAGLLTLLLFFIVAGLRNHLLPGNGPRYGVRLPKITSIAVLPLENLSGDPRQEYFADGMTEELITDLGKISALRVISRTSVMRYKGTRKPLPEIGRELHADAIVEGTVLRSGDHVRITANLLYAPNDRHLWAQSYERNVDDVLKLQSEVARAIASQIRIKLTPQEDARLAATRPVVPQAHRLYLLGRFYWNKRNDEGLRKASEQFQRAIEIDPTYAPAYAGLADSYLQLANNGVRPPSECMPKAKAAAQKALEIDPTLAQAHTSLAEIHKDYDWDWAASEREFKRAIRLNPNYATAHQWYAEYLTVTRRHAEAIAEAQQAEQLDPLSPIIRVGAATFGGYLYARQYDEAVRRLRETVSLFPEFEVAYRLLGDACMANGMDQDAFVAYRKWQSLSGASPGELAALEQAYAKGGMRGYYLWDLRRMSRLSKKRYVNAVLFAWAFARLDEKDEAFSYLERAYKERNWWLATLQVNPQFDPLRSDPRFQDLLRRMNFPP